MFPEQLIQAENGQLSMSEIWCVKKKKNNRATAFVGNGIRKEGIKSV